MPAVIATIPVGNFPGVVAVSPEGARAYVINNLGGSLSVIDTASNTVSATFPVSNNPRALALSPDGTLAYVTNSANTDFVSVIDITSNTIISTIPVGGIPNGVAVTPDGARAYVANGSGGTVSVINSATNTVTANIPVGAFPEGVAIAPDRPEWLARAVRAYVRPDRPGPALVVRLVTTEGAATIRIGPDSVDPVGDDAAVDVTLTGQAEVLAAAMDPHRVGDLVAAGQLHIDGEPRAVRRLAKVFDSPAR